MGKCDRCGRDHCVYGPIQSGPCQGDAAWKCANAIECDLDSHQKGIIARHVRKSIRIAKLDGYEHGLNELTPGIRKQIDRISALREKAQAVVDADAEQMSDGQVSKLHTAIDALAAVLGKERDDG